jgi:hypothetical protein
MGAHNPIWCGGPSIVPYYPDLIGSENRADTCKSYMNGLETHATIAWVSRQAFEYPVPTNLLF